MKIEEYKKQTQGKVDDWMGRVIKRYLKRVGLERFSIQSITEKEGYLFEVEMANGDEDDRLELEIRKVPGKICTVIPRPHEIWSLDEQVINTGKKTSQEMLDEMLGTPTAGEISEREEQDEADSIYGII